VQQLKVVAGEIVEIVQVFDGFNRYRFRADPTLQGAWDSARNILGPFRRRVTKPPVEAGDAPPQAGEVAPAA
jgi:hypothetical protein